MRPELGPWPLPLPLPLVIVLVIAINCIPGGRGAPLVETSVTSLGKSEPCCSSVCEKSFSSHLSLSSLSLHSKAEPWFACHRGCRFFSLIELLAPATDSQGQEARVRASCLSACAEAYNETSLAMACSLGCKNQVLLKLKQKKTKINNPHHLPLNAEAWAPGFVFRVGYSREEEEREEAEEERAEEKAPASLQLFRQFCSGFLNRVASSSLWVTKSSYTFLLGRGSDGQEKLILLSSKTSSSGDTESPPPPPPPPSSVQTQKPADTVPEVVVNTYPDMTSTYYNLEDDTKLVTGDKAATKIDLSPLFTSFRDSTSRSERRESGNWLECFNSGSAGSRWLFLTFATLTMLFLFWICCATLSATDQAIRRQVGMGSDLPYLLLHKDANGKVVLEDMVDEDDIFFSEDEETLGEMIKKVPLPPDEPPSYEEAQKQPRLTLVEAIEERPSVDQINIQSLV